MCLEKLHERIGCDSGGVEWYLSHPLLLIQVVVVMTSNNEEAIPLIP
jgi:hypothetical protein